MFSVYGFWLPQFCEEFNVDVPVSTQEYQSYPPAWSGDCTEMYIRP